jgi:hypothetical protein
MAFALPLQRIFLNLDRIFLTMFFGVQLIYSPLCFLLQKSHGYPGGKILGSRGMVESEHPPACESTQKYKTWFAPYFEEFEKSAARRHLGPESPSLSFPLFDFCCDFALNSPPRPIRSQHFSFSASQLFPVAPP